MSNDKLYYSDAYLKEAHSRITSRKFAKNGVWVTLESTLFYPGGGGQSPDSGWINDLEVLEIKHETGDYWYRLDQDPQDDVILKLDWDHRHSKMQQHTGQHILSAVFYRMFNIDTISVHLGQKETLIELDCDELSEEELHRAEHEANYYIRQNYPVSEINIKPDEISKYNIRRDIKHAGSELRLVRIGDFDCTGCGGTHVKSTTEVGLIKILDKEKIRGHIRLSSVIGSMAYQYFTELHGTVQKIGAILSSGVLDLPSRIEGLLNENKSLKRDNKAISQRWIKEYATRLEPNDSIGYFVLSDIYPAEIVQLVQNWLSIYKFPCYIIGKFGDKIHFVFGLPPNTNPAADIFIKQISEELSLRGGGNSELVQGVINDKDLSDEYINLTLEKLRDNYNFKE